MKFLYKIQSLQEKHKKIMFWSIIIVVAILLLGWNIHNFKKRIANLSGQGVKQDLQIYELKENLGGLSEKFKDIKNILDQIKPPE